MIVYYIDKYFNLANKVVAGNGGAEFYVVKLLWNPLTQVALYQFSILICKEQNRLHDKSNMR